MLYTNAVLYVFFLYTLWYVFCFLYASFSYVLCFPSSSNLYSADLTHLFRSYACKTYQESTVFCILNNASFAPRFNMHSKGRRSCTIRTPVPIFVAAQPLHHNIVYIDAAQKIHIAPLLPSYTSRRFPSRCRLYTRIRTAHTLVRDCISGR